MSQYPRYVSVKDTLSNNRQLFNVNEDFNELNDLAKSHPEKLEGLKKLFDTEAKKNNPYPLIDHKDRFNRRKNLSPK